MNTPIQRNVYNNSVVNTNTPMNTPKRRGRPPGSGKSNSKYNAQNSYKKTYNYTKKKGKSNKEFSGSSDDFSDNFDESTSEDEKKDFSNEDDWEDYATTPVTKSTSEKEKQPYSGKKRGRKPKNFHLLAENKEPSFYRVFDTDLANMAADAVLNNTFISIVEFHKSKGLSEVHRTPVNPVTPKSTPINNQSMNSSRMLNSKPTNFNYNEQKSDKLKLPMYDNTHSIPTNMISRPVNNVIVQTQTPVGFAPSSLGNSMFGANNQLGSKQFFDMSAGQNPYAHQQILKNAADMNNIMSHPLNDQFYSNAVYVPNSFSNNQNNFCNSPNNFIKNNTANNIKPMVQMHSNSVQVQANLMNNKRPYLPINSPNSLNQQQFNSFSQNAINRSGFIQHNMNSGVMSVNPSSSIVMEPNCQTNTTNQ